MTQKLSNMNFLFYLSLYEKKGGGGCITPYDAPCTIWYNIKLDMLNIHQPQ